MHGFVVLILSLALAIASPVLGYASGQDSITVIHSLYSDPEKELGPVFMSTANGDTTVMAYTSQVNRDTSATDTFAVRVRSWNSLSRTRISSNRFYCIQSYLSRRPIVQLVLLQNKPNLIYTPSPTVLSVADVFTGVEIRKFSFTYEITSVSYSRDYAYSFVTTGTNNYYILNNLNGEVVLSDSTRVDRISIKGDSLTRQIANCAPESWTLDNSLVMIRISTLVLRYSNGDGLSYASVWQPFDIVKKQYINKTFDFQRIGWWLPDAKRFFTFNSRSFYITDLTGHVDSTQVGADKTIIDFGWASGSDRFTLIDLNNSISVWETNPISKIIDFNPGKLVGYAFNKGGTKLAYVTDDNVLRVIDTRSLQGIHTIQINFPHKINLADRSTLRFVNGDLAMVVQDKDNKYRILDLPASTIVATVDSTTIWQASQDGTALFVFEDRISRFDLFTGKKLSVFPDNEFTTKVKGIAISPDGVRVVSYDSTVVSLWSAQQGVLMSQRYFSKVQQLLWSPDTSMVIVVHKDSLLDLNAVTGINGSTLETVYTVSAVTNTRLLEFCPDKRHFLTSSGDSLFIRDIHTGVATTALSNSSEVRAANLSLNGIHLAIGDVNGEIKVFNLSNKTTEFALNTGRTIRSVKLSPGGAYIEYVSDAGMQLISLADGLKRQELSTPTVDDLFIGGDSLCVGIYNTAIVEFTLPNGHPSKIELDTRPHFRSDCKYYANAGFRVRDSLKIFSYKTKQLDRAVTDIASDDVLCWSDDGSTLATLDIFNNVVVWRPMLPSAIVDVSTENQSFADDSNVIAFPNPCSTYVTLRSGLTIEEIRVNDLLGSAVIVEPTDTNQTSIDLGSLSAGHYTIGVKTRLGWSYSSVIVTPH